MLYDCCLALNTFDNEIGNFVIAKIRRNIDAQIIYDQSLEIPK